MSREGVQAVRLAVGEVSEVLRTLTPEEWERPSGCEGWRVQDLVAHMSSNYKEIVDPSPPPSEPINLPAERLMDLLVAPRHDWTPEQVLEEYLTFAPRAEEILASMQEEPLASTVIPLADLGQYPMHQLADAFAFDHYCHLRVDLLAPHGPIVREIDAPDAARLGPALSWMIAGIPQMQADLPAALDGPITLRLSGPAGGDSRIANEDGKIVITPGGAAGVANVSSDGHAFVIWGTKRAPWRDHCTVSGDGAVAAKFFDALNIV